MRHIGFTGTRAGMNIPQKEQWKWLLWYALRGAALELHVGRVDGADGDAIEIALESGRIIPELIHIHPCPGVVAQHGGPPYVWHEVFPPLKRDRIIAADTDLLVAAPRADKEELRSGTWATVRYARQALKPIIMLSRGEGR